MSRYRDTHPALSHSAPPAPSAPTSTARASAVTKTKTKPEPQSSLKSKRVRRYTLPPHLAGTLLREHRHTPYFHQAITDRLAFVLPFGKGIDESVHKHALRQVALQIKKALESEKCTPVYVKSPRYRHNLSLPLLSNPQRAVFIQIGALQAGRQRGDIRIDLNPARMTAEDIAHFHKFMRRLIGKTKYNELMSQPFINVWHPAVDIRRLHLDHCLMTVSKVEHRTVFGKILSAEGIWNVDEPDVMEQDDQISGTVVAKRSNNMGSIETINFGSMSSDYFTCVYGKSIEAIHRAVEGIARAGRLTKKPLMEKAVRQLMRAKDAPPRVRVEVRGRKMRGVPPWALDKITNRFEKIHFVDLADPSLAPNIPVSMRAACIALYRDSGRNAVYAAFNDSKHLKEIQRWLDGASDPAWWKPQQYWKQAIEDLQRKNLFPPSAWDAGGRTLPSPKAKRKSNPKIKSRAFSKAAPRKSIQSNG